MVAVYVDSAFLLLVRSSYRAEWHLPGGGIRRGETPEAAARRELAEETGLNASVLLSIGTAYGVWDGRRDRVHFFDLQLGELPTLKLDNREIIAARFVPMRELPSVALTEPTVAYMKLRAEILQAAARAGSWVLVCSACGSHEVDFVVSGGRR